MNCYGYVPRHVSDMEALKISTLRNTSKASSEAAWRILSGIEVEFTVIVSIS